jgi:hypothetical protein
MASRELGQIKDAVACEAGAPDATRGLCSWIMLYVTSENPAWELHDLLRSWQVTPSGVSVLGYRSPDDPAAWFRSHERAIELLAEIERYLEVLQLRTPSRQPGLVPAMDRLRRGVFSTNRNMEEISQSGCRHFQDEDLQTLAATADGWNRLDAPIESLREMATVAVLARDLVKAVDSLDEGVRRYIEDVIAALEIAALEAAIKGGAPVGRLALELSAALEVYIPESEANPESKTSIVARLRRGARDFLIYFAIPYASQLAASATMLAIQPGPAS